MTIAAELHVAFVTRFGKAPEICRAPGRVNLIGEHTDYNDGFVLPAALDLATYAAAAPRDDRRVVVHSCVFNATAEFDLDDPAPAPRQDWSDYVRGVAVALGQAGHKLRGADIMLRGDLPMGAGLSASASVEVVVGFALCRVSKIDIDLETLALLCQLAENGFVGVRCGVMDQMISCHGVEGHALLIDCRTLERTPVSIDDRVRIVICNTMIKHELASSAYNERREECEHAVALLSRVLDGIRALRDVTPDALALHAASMPERILRRARHVVTENRRVLDMAAALKRGDLSLCGRLMNASHLSLRDDYEVSCAESDLMAALAQQCEGVFGARMTGGGFGGCTVNLVERQSGDRFIENISEKYRKATSLIPQIFCCAPSAGVGMVAFP
ncbi:MAG: galactokinase [Methylocystis sp.]|nr:galactokinase [Methylocystis sp.]